MAWSEYQRQQYLAANPDVAAAGMDPFEHYNAFGASEGRAAPQTRVQQSGLDVGAIDWNNYVAANNDLAGMNAQQAQQHWNDYGQFEQNRSLGYQTAANQGQFYNLRDGSAIGPTNTSEMNAFVNNNFNNHTGFDANTYAGTGGGVADPNIMNPDAVGFVLGGGSLNGGSYDQGWTAPNGNAVGGLGGLGGAPQNTFDYDKLLADLTAQFGDMQNAWQQQQQDYWQQMQDQWGQQQSAWQQNQQNQWQNQWQQQQSQWDSMYDNLNQWGQMAYNGAGTVNNNFQSGQPNNVSPVYNPTPGNGQPRNGWGGPLGNNNPWSPTF